ncbi:hypothetical protein MNBD_NITROSPINAE04-657 [hydrothermal vent metagenome]|uniref:Uncharacterized protein n=1 Tax=hydrothermal vent metagenome TaxID=652676 RepID=A0A3B1C934_9ZZZZ
MKRIIALLLIFSVAYFVGSAAAQSKKLAAEMIQKSLLEAKTTQETKPILDPAIYAREFTQHRAYQIAKEIPHVLDKLFCYCYCAINPRFKHKSLKTCYTGNHAAECGVCMREAFIAKQMTDDGKTPEQIATVFTDMYAK